MDKRVKISFDGQSKAVVASVTIEYSGDIIKSNEEILEETKDLYTKADLIAVQKTIQKMR